MYRFHRVEYIKRRADRHLPPLSLSRVWGHRWLHSDLAATSPSGPAHAGPTDGCRIWLALHRQWHTPDRGGWITAGGPLPGPSPRPGAASSAGAHRWTEWARPCPLGSPPVSGSGHRVASPRALQAAGPAAACRPLECGLWGSAADACAQGSLRSCPSLVRCCRARSRTVPASASAPAVIPTSRHVPGSLGRPR